MRALRSRGPGAGVTLLGTGCPLPDLNRRGPSQVVWAGGQPLLVDCGHGVLYQMIRAGIDPKTVTELYITHLHSDHYAGLIHLVMGSWSLGRNKLRVFGPPGTSRFINVLFNDLMKKDIEFRISVKLRPEGIRDIRVVEITAGRVLSENGLNVTAARVQHDSTIECFAFRFESEGKTVVVSGDTTYCQEIVDLAQGADILVHECSYFLPPGVDPAAAASGSYWGRKNMLQQHSGPREAARVGREAGVRKLVLTHIMPSVECALALAKCADEFEGEVYFGEDLMEIEA